MSKKVFLVGIILLLSFSCNIDGLFGRPSWLKDFDPLVEYDALIYLYCPTGQQIIAFDPLNEKVLRIYSFPGHLSAGWLIEDPQNEGFYYGFSDGRKIHINTLTGKVTQLTGYNYYTPYMGYNLSTNEVYLAGSYEKTGQLYFRTITMPDNILGEEFELPGFWMNKYNSVLSENGNLVLTLERSDNYSKTDLYFPFEKKSINLVEDYFGSDDKNAIFFLNNELLNANFLFNTENESDGTLFKLYKINSLEPIDLSLIYQMNNPFNHLFDTGDAYVIFSQAGDHKALRKISYEGELLLPEVYLDFNDLTNYTIREYNGCYYDISYDGTYILRIDKNLNCSKISTDLDSLN